jgi:uncharacterized membrane protein
MDRSRLEAFSDGVFAVAITLLALDLTVAGPGHGHLIDQLDDKWPAFLAYLVSFFMIGIVWVNHHMLVRSIIKVDRTLLFLNLVLLLFVVLIPFATATEADYFPHNGPDARLAMALYAGALLGMSVGFAGILEWTLHGQRVDQPVPPELRWRARARFAGGGLVYVIAIALAWFSALASFVLIVLIALYYILENTPARAARGPAGSGPGESGPDDRAQMIGADKPE